MISRNPAVANISSTIANLPQPGLVLVKTQTIGTGVSTVTVTDAFSADYDNYLITVNGGACSTSTFLNFQCGTVSAGYRFSYLYTTYVSTPLAVGTVAQNSIQAVGFASVNGINSTIGVSSPFLSTPTLVTGDGGIIGDFAGRVTGFEPNATSFTSFTILPNSGTLTGGTIRVYGYRN